MVCVHKAVNDIPKAIDVLVRYVQELYTTDAAAWHELAELYLSVQRFVPSSRLLVDSDWSEWIGLDWIGAAIRRQHIATKS